MLLKRVLLCKDCDQSYWKWRFLSELPKLFTKRVKNAVKKENDNTIPYQDLTYGELVNFVNQEGLALCNNLKLKTKLKSKRSESCIELGSFCEQYGFDKIVFPSSKLKKKSFLSYKRRKSFPKRENFQKSYPKNSSQKRFSKKKFQKLPMLLVGNANSLDIILINILWRERLIIFKLMKILNLDFLILLVPIQIINLIMKLNKFINLKKILMLKIVQICLQLLVKIKNFVDVKL